MTGEQVMLVFRTRRDVDRTVASMSETGERELIQALPRPEMAARANGATRSTPQPRSRPPRLLLAMPILLIIALAAWLLRPTSTDGLLTASGTIEADEVMVAAEVGGRLAELGVDEGSSVRAGQVIGRLADAVLDVQLKQAASDPAQQQILQAQLDKLQLRAPIGGVVQRRLVRGGEVVAPGAPIVTIADSSDMQLTLYVLERDLGRVRVGQEVAIRAAAFPDRVFQGSVQSIATRAEFTPRYVQTQKDRQNLVFAVRVRMPNPDRLLKAGLPVDATFQE
jgi:multidrug resistance efflux pump